MNLRDVAKAAGRRRCEEIEVRVQQAVEAHAPDALVDAGPSELRIRGRGLKGRWLSHAGLRFARRIGA